MKKYKNISLLLIIVLFLVIQTTIANSFYDTLQNDSFSFIMLEDSIVKARPGDVVEIVSRINNLTNHDLYINIERTEVIMPDGWSTQFCAKGCFPPEISFRTMYLSPLESDFFGVYVATNGNEGIGIIKFYFENKDNHNESFFQSYIVESYSYNQVNNATLNLNKFFVNSIFINFNSLNIDLNSNIDDNYRIEVYNSLGQLIYKSDIYTIIGRNIYYIELYNPYETFYFIKISMGEEFQTFKLLTTNYF